MFLKAFLLLLCLTSCGYRAEKQEEKIAVCVPFVKKDNEGQLTSEIAHQLAQNSRYSYVKEGGDVVLKVEIVSDSANRIGFMYDRHPFSGKLKKNLFSTENRRTIEAEVTVLGLQEDKPLFGPTRVSASSEFDYVDINSLYDLSFIAPNGKREKVLNYSLGQLDSVEGAQDDALFVLYRVLAQKIVAGLDNIEL